MKEEKIHIAFCSDSNYVMPTGVAVASICENNKEENLVFHIVVTDGKSEEMDALKKIVSEYKREIFFYPISSSNLLDFACKGSNHVSVTGFARVLLPDLLPNSINKVIYLDGDTITLRSVRPLWDFFLKEDEPLAAVVDESSLSPLRRKPLKTPLTIPYCNSGVLLLNLDCWRKEGLQSKVSECAREKSFPLLDQDVLHYFFQERVKLLPITFNTQMGFLNKRMEEQWVDYRHYEDLAEALRNPTIVHFTGQKPWKSKNTMYWEEWYYYFNKIDFPDIIYKETPPAFVKSKFFKNIDYFYWMDYDLFCETITPYMNFYGVVLKMRHRRTIMKLVSWHLRILTRILSTIYSRNLRKNHTEDDLKDKIF